MRDTNNTLILKLYNFIPGSFGISVQNYPKSKDIVVRIEIREQNDLKEALSKLENKEFTELDLSYNDLSKFISANSLNEALSGLENTKVTSLNLSYNGPYLVNKLLSTDTAFKNIHTLTLSASDINSLDVTKLKDFLEKKFPNILTLKDENGTKVHENHIGRSQKIHKSCHDYIIFDKIQEATRFHNDLVAITTAYLEDEQIAESRKKDESSSKGILAAKCLALLSLIHGLVLLFMILLPREILSTKIAKAEDFFKNKIFVITVALFIIFTISAIAAAGQSARTKKRANVTGNTHHTPPTGIPLGKNNT